MSQSARASPTVKERNRRDFDDIGKATEAAMARVSSARSRLEAQRKAKSMPNTPVDAFGGGFGVDSGTRTGRFSGAEDVGGTRLDFLKVIDEEERGTQSEAKVEAKVEDAVERLVRQAAEKCEKLAIDGLDVEVATASAARGESTSAPAAVVNQAPALVPAPRDLPKAAPVVVKSAPVKSVEFKPPECYRNSRNSSAAPLDAPIPDNPNDADASPANGDQCVVM
jgi:hypothetical protein